jgi:hypothetical protein
MIVLGNRIIRKACLFMGAGRGVTLGNRRVLERYESSGKMGLKKTYPFIGAGRASIDGNQRRK